MNTSVAHTKASIQEICVASALAALGASNLLIWQFAPFSTFFMLLSAFPFTLVGMREKLRISLLCVCIAMCIGFLIGGRILLQECFAIGILGISVGYCEKKNTRKIFQIGFALILGFLASFIVIGALLTFTKFRELNLQTFHSLGHGLCALFAAIGLPAVEQTLGTVIDYLLSHWLYSALVFVPLFVLGAFNLVRLLFAIPLRSTNKIISETNFHIHSSQGKLQPVPIHLHNVSYQYQPDKKPVPHRLNATIESTGLTAITGSNGAGKSTTVKLITGILTPTAGSIERPGEIGLGSHQGTAIVFQRPESQVLGINVKDDIHFGNNSASIDVDEALSRVGLKGLDQRYTSDLSGGQLQRLAIASALTRNPQLLISDESTSMLDPEGRKHVMDIYLQQSTQRSVVHISHNRQETAQADYTIELGGDTLSQGINASDTSDYPPLPSDNIHHSCPTISTENPPIPDDIGIRLSHVYKIYNYNTPWQQQTLHDFHCEFRRGEKTVITGHNGSGKSTLARIIAGLETPTSGEIVIDHPDDSRPSVLLSIQNSAAQLLAPTVQEELNAYHAHSPQESIAALHSVGLTEEILGQHPQTLSGGQQKRVVLASLFTSKPHILILDEPLAGCDQESITIINQAIEQLSRQGVTIIVITHDLEAHNGLFDRHIHIENGRIRSDTSPTSHTIVVPSGTDTIAEDQTHFVPHHSSDSLRLKNIFGRTLPWTSPAHNLWIGTKLYILIAIIIAIFIKTDWQMFATIALILFIWTCTAKVPFSAIPKPTWKFALFFSLGMLGSMIGAKENMVYLGSLGISLHGINLVLQLLFMASAMVYGYILFTYSTPLAEISPFLQRINAKFSHSPFITSLCIGIVLGLRQLTLISKETQTMRQLATLRANERSTQGFFQRIVNVELAISLHSCALTIRLAQEMALAIIARGGVDTIGSQDKKITPTDVVVMTLCTVLLAATVVVPIVMSYL